METNSNLPSPGKLWTWFNPLNRQAGSWAFILNRITAIGLTVYLFLHLIVLGQLAQGPDAYNNFLAMIDNPLYKISELFVLAGVLIHGLNGVRVILNSFGIAVPQQKQLFAGVMVLAIVLTAMFAWRMFAG